MASISRSRRSTAGIILIIAGALLLLTVILPLLNVTSVPWLALLAYAGIAAAFVILAVGAVINTVAKVALIAGAVGWAILVVAGLAIALPGILITIAAVLAALGGLVGAIVLYTGKEITNRAALAFVVAAILGVLYLLGLIGTFSLGSLGTVIALLFGAAVVVTGVLFRQTERGRR